MTEMTEWQIRKIHNDQVLMPYRLAVDLVWGHSQIVAEIAEQLARKWIKQNGNQIDFDLLKFGALIHDVGVYQCYFNNEDYSKHGVLGRKLLKKYGIPKELARFADCHMAMTKEEVKFQRLAIPVRDYLPETTEEELIYFADNFHTKVPRFIFPSDAKTRSARYGSGRVERFDRMSAKYGFPDLTMLEAKYSAWHEYMSLALNPLEDTN